MSERSKLEIEMRNERLVVSEAIRQIAPGMFEAEAASLRDQLEKAVSRMQAYAVKAIRDAALARPTQDEGETR